MRREGENISAESSSVSSSSIRAGLPSTPKIRVKLGDLSLIKETGGDYIPPSSLANYTTSLSRRILPSAPRERLTTLEQTGPLRQQHFTSPYKAPIKVPSEPSRSKRSEAATERGNGPSKGATKQPSRSSRESEKQVACGNSRDEGTSSRAEVREDGVQTEVSTEEEVVNETATATADVVEHEERGSPTYDSDHQQPLSKGASAQHASVSTETERMTNSTLFNGFSRLDRKWFDNSGYNGCLDRLEELEMVVEAQFKDLSSKGYDASAALLKDPSLKMKGLQSSSSSPLQMEALYNLEKLVEQQHKDLVNKGVLPEDSVKIFTS